jgi:hypothetical protein
MGIKGFRVFEWKNYQLVHICGMRWTYDKNKCGDISVSLLLIIFQLLSARVPSSVTNYAKKYRFVPKPNAEIFLLEQLRNRDFLWDITCSYTLKVTLSGCTPRRAQEIVNELSEMFELLSSQNLR